MRRFILALAAAFSLAAAPGTAGPLATSAIRVSALPVPLNPSDPAQTRVGRLVYLGGLELRSTDARFGGISGMRLRGDDELIAVTDSATWLTLRLVERDGRLHGIDAAAMAPLPGLDGRPMRGKLNGDAEALEITENGLTVAFERRHRLQRYPSMLERARRVRFPDEQWLEALPDNSGIEAMARMGTLWVYIAEETRGQAPNAVISRDGGDNRAYNRVSVAAEPGFSPTDAQTYGDGQMLLLSRSFAPLAGARAALQLFQVDADRLQLGAGELVATLAPPLTVDNMEALAVRQAGDRIFIYIASDNNFSPLQRTLLMKFELLPTSATR